jgi:cell division protein FtsB
MEAKLPRISEAERTPLVEALLGVIAAQAEKVQEKQRLENENQELKDEKQKLEDENQRLKGKKGAVAPSPENRRGYGTSMRFDAYNSVSWY